MTYAAVASNPTGPGWLVCAIGTRKADTRRAGEAWIADRDWLCAAVYVGRIPPGAAADFKVGALVPTGALAGQ